MAEEATCPLCVEVLDPTEQGFFPCPCQYQVCLWCVHHIREQLSGNCPACRKPYLDENFVTDEAIKQKAIDRAKEKEKEAKEAAALRVEQMAEAAAKTEKLSIAEWESQRKRREELSKLTTVRVVQRNVIYVMGIAPSIAKADILKRPEFFGQYGHLLKVSINQLNFVSRGNSTGSGGAYAAYLTFSTNDEAKSAKDSVDGFEVDGQTLRVTFGTTRYCQSFIKDIRCNKTDCAFLHTLVEKPPERKRRGRQRNRERAEHPEKQREQPNSEQRDRSANDQRPARESRGSGRTRKRDPRSGKEPYPDRSGSNQQPVPNRSDTSDPRWVAGSPDPEQAHGSRDGPASPTPVPEPSQDFCGQVDPAPMPTVAPPEPVHQAAPAATSGSTQAGARVSSELSYLTPPPMPPPAIPRSPLSVRLSIPTDGPPPPNFAPPPIPVSIPRTEDGAGPVSVDGALATYDDTGAAYAPMAPSKKLAPLRNDRATEEEFYSVVSGNVWSDASAVSASVSDEPDPVRGKLSGAQASKTQEASAPLYAYAGYEPAVNMKESSGRDLGRDRWPSQNGWERDGRNVPEPSERRRRGKKSAMEWKPVLSPAISPTPWQEWNDWNQDARAWEDPWTSQAPDGASHSQGIDLLQSIFPNTKVMLASEKWDWRPSGDWRPSDAP